jgi:hypothetical protein
VAETRRCGNHSLQTTVDHAGTVAPMYDRVNVDC